PTPLANHEEVGMFRSRRAVCVLVGVLAVMTSGVVALNRWVALAAVTCDRNATPSSFASEVSAATAGQTICLAAGNYGTFQGTNKAITIRSQTGAAATMGLNLDTGDSGFTVDGLTIPGADVRNGAKNITVRNSAF